MSTVRKPGHDWSWGGCGDNVGYGYKKSRQFLEALFRKKADAKTLIMLHNNEVGRLVGTVTFSRFSAVGVVYGRSLLWNGSPPKSIDLLMME